MYSRDYYSLENHLNYSLKDYLPLFSPCQQNFIMNNYQKPFYQSFSLTDYQAKRSKEEFSSRVIKEKAFVPEIFLSPKRRPQPFICNLKEIEPLIKEAFKLTTGLNFPEDVVINLLPKKEFIKLNVSENTLGLAINRKEFGLVSEIFVLNDELDKTLLTIGHEIGHVLTKPLNDPIKEEAKAFAFSLAWIKTIQENNLANLKDSFIFPAENGLHDQALNLVLKGIDQGKRPLEVYRHLVLGGLW